MPNFDITIAGEINLDLILYGLPEGLPEERELLAEDALLTLGSSSAILAHNLAALGARVGFVTRVGRDPFGQVALERLREAGVDTSHVVHAKGAAATGLTVILPHGAKRRILTYPGTMFEMSYADLDLRYLADAKHFHMSSFFLHRGLRERIPELFRRMKKAGLSTSLDTNDDPEDRWNGILEQTLNYVDVFLPNERELCKVTRSNDLGQAIGRMAAKVPVLAVKLGPRGALAAYKGRPIEGHPLRVKATDPVGAGDSFDAGFLYQFIRGASLEKCLAWGNMAGAFSTKQPGGTEAFRDRKSWRAFLRAHQG